MLNIFKIEPRIWTQAPNNFKGTKSKWIKRIDSIDEIPRGLQVGLFYPKICGVILHAIFGTFASGRKKEITKQIIESNKDFKIALIRAFFDDEGGPNTNSYNICIYQDNKTMLECLQNMLKDEKIQTNEIASYVKRDKNRYRFSITGHYNLIRFSKSIGFTSTVKKDNLNKMIQNIQEKKTFKLKHEETKGIIGLLLQKNDALTTKEIGELLKEKFPDFKWNKSTVLQHLADLEKRKIASKEIRKNKYLWSKI